MPLTYRYLLGLCLLLGWSVAAWAQAGKSYSHRLPLEIEQIPQYSFGHSTSSAYIFRLDYAGSRFNQAVSFLEHQQFKQIDLVFTLYPKRPEDWKVGYDSLLARRFRMLESRIPQAFQDTTVRWRLMIQTACNSMTEAKALFHGFVCYPANSEFSELQPIDSLPTMRWEEEQPRYDSLDLLKNFATIDQILAGEKSSKDSTAYLVFDRHPEWKNALVVIDWTASMYRQGAMVVKWQQSHASESHIKHFVFFNDGDQKYDKDKVVGSTGGIYESAADSLSKMMPILRAVTMGGEGGDHRENDLEAILEGIASCPDCEQIILIADNTGPVRDMALLQSIDLPVRVLLCSVYKDQFETDYLDIVDHTKGSLHTRDRDIPDLKTLTVKGILKIGEKEYSKSNGHWSKYEPRL